MIIGIDTGGTFIDLVLLAADGTLHFHKQLADTGDLAGSVMRGIAGLAASCGIGAGALLADTTMIAHGTTLATNAVLTRSGAPTALLTTEGLRDALEMRRGVKEDVYDLHYVAPRPLVGREHRHGVDERIDSAGAVLRPLRMEPALDALGVSIAQGSIRAIAVCLMHSWRNPAHEAALGARLRDLWPQHDIVCSHEVLPQAGFYDRVSTTVMSAYAAPIIRAYLGGLADRLAAAGFAGRLYVVTSAGGLMTPRDAVMQAARTVLSGPAAAPVFGAALCRRAGFAQAMIVDMGGTSFDLTLILDGAPVQASGGAVDGLRIAFPVTDVATIALGGGSIAWVDAGGLLRLGPRSAGAVPGSACFDRGGTEPTITDADVMLGYLDAESFARSGLRIDRDRARRALDDHLPAAAGAVESAVSIYRLAAALMADAVQRGALAAGLDYRAAPLIVGGGAGPLHACAIGHELGAETIVVPAAAATLCAMGALLLEPKYDAVRSLFVRLDATTADDILAACAALAESVRPVAPADWADTRQAFVADMRYVGQGHHLATRFTPEQLRAEGTAVLATLFEAVHTQHHGHRLPGTDIEILAIRLTVSWIVPRPPPRLSGTTPAPATHRTRTAYDPGSDCFVEFAWREWAAMQPGDAVPGPALIAMPGTTCVVLPPYTAWINPDRDLVLRRTA